MRKRHFFLTIICILGFFYQGKSQVKQIDLSKIMLTTSEGELVHPPEFNSGKLFVWVYWASYHQASVKIVRNIGEGWDEAEMDSAVKFIFVHPLAGGNRENTMKIGVLQFERSLSAKCQCKTYYDADWNVAKTLGRQYVPYSLLLDSNGNVLKVLASSGNDIDEIWGNIEEGVEEYLK